MFSSHNKKQIHSLLLYDIKETIGLLEFFSLDAVNRVFFVLTAKFLASNLARNMVSNLASSLASNQLITWLATWSKKTSFFQ